MAAMAMAGERVERDVVNAKYAATIPATCTVLPVAIESRAKTFRLVLSAGLMSSFEAGPDCIVAIAPQ